jgi:hypothetical protein
MTFQISFRRTTACALVLGAALAIAPRPARADVSIDAGAAVTGSSANLAGALSVGVFNVPLIPLATELTAIAPENGGFATTFDARFTVAGTAIGAGAGVGTLGAMHQTSVIYDGILAHGIAPHTALEARMYFGPLRPSTFFGGVRFSL